MKNRDYMRMKLWIKVYLLVQDESAWVREAALRVAMTEFDKEFPYTTED